MMLKEFFTPPSKDRSDGNLYLMFRASVALKAAISAAEVFVGLLIFFIPLSVFTDPVAAFAEGQLAENPESFIANNLLEIIAGISIGTQLFVTFYLLSRGLVKLIPIMAVLKNRLWGYPVSLVILGAFVAYQLYYLSVKYSLVVLAVTIFDVLVMYLIWREYRFVKRYRAELERIAGTTANA